MVTTSFNYHSLRARNARMASRLKVPGLAEVASFTALSAAALYLLSQHHAIGWTLTGLALIQAIFTIWYHWDLKGDDNPHLPLDRDQIQLERVVEPQLLAMLHPGQAADELWRSALHQWQGVFVVQRLNLPYATVAEAIQGQPADAIWSKSVELARANGAAALDSGVVIAATLLVFDQLKPLLNKISIKPPDVLAVLAWQQRVAIAIDRERHPLYLGGIGRDWASGYTPLLNTLGVNLSREVSPGDYRYQPATHAHIIDQMLEDLAVNRPVALVGGVGSGKTALVYALAERLMANQQVGRLSYYQIISLNPSILISSGAQIEDLVLQLLGEGVRAKNTILFLDDAQMFLQSGTGAVDLTQILQPVIQRQALKLIVALSDHDWQQLVASRPALANSLQRLVVPETSPDETLAVVQDVAIGIEHTTHSLVLHEAIKESIKLAERYLPEAAFPGKAITVLESAGHYAESGHITAASVQQAVEATTGAKVTAAAAPEREQLLNLEKEIHTRMINQSHAVKAVAAALRRARAGVANPNRPVGSFLFLGPTGVGKTELAKALAAVYFGSEQSMIRLDMSEYQQPADVARLLDPRSRSQAGQTLLAAVRQRPSSVVLLDEIEKAHPDILNLLLQVLDEGRLTDSEGRPVSFKDSIVITTSNAGADEIRARIDKGEAIEKFQAEITQGLIESHQFRPELLNRFDELVVFRPLTKPELRQVVELLLKGVNATLKAQDVEVKLTAAAADWLADKGYDPAFGARPLRRIIQRSVENLVAEKLLAGAIQPGQTATFDVADLEAAAAD